VAGYCPRLGRGSDAEPLVDIKNAGPRSHMGGQRRRGTPLRLQWLLSQRRTTRPRLNRRRSALHALGLGGDSRCRFEPALTSPSYGTGAGKLPAEARTKDPARVRQELHRPEFHRGARTSPSPEDCTPATTLRNAATTNRLGYETGGRLRKGRPRARAPAAALYQLMKTALRALHPEMVERVCGPPKGKVPAGVR